MMSESGFNIIETDVPGGEIDLDRGRRELREKIGALLEARVDPKITYLLWQKSDQDGTTTEVTVDDGVVAVVSSAEGTMTSWVIVTNREEGILRVKAFDDNRQEDLPDDLFEGEPTLEGMNSLRVLLARLSEWDIANRGTSSFQTF